MRILITNDDGISAPGMEVLARSVARWIERCPEGETREAIIVAPHENYSGMSSAVGDVHGHPYVHYKRFTISGAESIPAYSLEGPPALCAILGTVGYFNFRPNMILSGINAGANVGRSVLHSGTIGAILTGAQLGLSGLAVSVQWGENVHFETAGEVAVEVLQELMNAPTRTLFNLNVPNLPVSELKGVRRGRISTAGLIKGGGSRTAAEPLADEGELQIRLGAATPELGDVSDEDADEDGALLAAGYASLTPLKGPQEDTDTALDEHLYSALAAIERHLDSAR
jgi:5'-nucleotidase